MLKMRHGPALHVQEIGAVRVRCVQDVLMIRPSDVTMTMDASPESSISIGLMSGCWTPVPVQYPVIATGPGAQFMQNTKAFGVSVGRVA